MLCVYDVSCFPNRFLSFLGAFSNTIGNEPSSKTSTLLSGIGISSTDIHQENNNNVNKKQTPEPWELPKVRDVPAALLEPISDTGKIDGRIGFRPKAHRAKVKRFCQIRANHRSDLKGIGNLETVPTTLTHLK